MTLSKFEEVLQSYNPDLYFKHKSHDGVVAIFSHQRNSTQARDNYTGIRVDKGEIHLSTIFYTKRDQDGMIFKTKRRGRRDVCIRLWRAGFIKYEDVVPISLGIYAS